MGRVQRKEAPSVQLGEGNVPIKLDGVDLELKPTLFAATRVSALTGGFAPAVDAVRNLNLEVMTTVIALGLGLTAHGAKDIPEKVFGTGAISLMAPVIRYINILANGGRPLENTEGEGEDGGPQNA